MLLSLAWRNIWRQRTRTVLSLISMAFTSLLLVFMLSLQLGSYDTMKTNTLRVFDGFAQLQPPGYADNPDIATFIADPAPVIAAAERVPGVTVATPRASSFVILANGDVSYGAAVLGVDPASEPQVTRLAASLLAGRYLRPGDSDAAVLGASLARNLGVGIGDRVTLLGSAADRTVAADSLRVVGLFRTGMPQIDRQIAHMPVARFQETFAMPGAAHVIVLGGRRLAEVNRARPQLRRLAAEHGLVLRDWAALQPALKQAITLDFSTSLTIYVSLVIVVVFIILNTLYMSVLERTREFGVLLAIGMRPGAIGRMLWLELILLAVLGCGIGIGLGSALVLFFQSYGIPVSGAAEIMEMFGLPARLYPSLSAVSAVAGPLAVVLSVALGGVLPFARILRLRPVAAMGAA